MDHLKTLFSSLEDRYCAVKRSYRRLSGGAISFELIDACNDSKRVIVPRHKIHSEDELTELTEVFLERQTKTGNWIAATWPRETNPWLTNKLPSVGQTLNGTVSAFIDDFAAVVEVQFEGQLFEFNIHKEQLPSYVRSRNIRETLFKGDLVAGRMLPANRAELRLSLDVSSWVESLSRYWRTASQYHRVQENVLDKEHHLDLSKKLAEFSRIEKKRVLIVEDSIALSGTIASSLEEIGCSVTVVNAGSDPSLIEAVKRALKSAYDVVLLDFQLDVPADEQQEIQSAIKMAQIESSTPAVLIFSGNLTTAPKFAAENNFGYLSKPVSPYEICRWVQTPKKHVIKSKNQAERQRRATFSVESKTVQVIKKTNQLLDKLCKRHDLLGAAWFIELTPDRFELRAHSSSLENSVTKDMVEGLAHSVVNNALAEKSPQHGFLSKNDPMFQLFPVESKARQLFYFAFPLLPKGQAPRVIVFFGNHPFVSKTRARIQDRGDHFELLMENIAQTEALDEISASASIGRVALGAIHDIRTELATIQAILNSSGSIYDDAEKIKLLLDNLPRAYSLSKESLNLFQPSGSSKFRLADTITNICQPLRRYVRDEFPDTVVEILTDTSEIPDLDLFINPIPIERSIINLVDNAAHYCASSPISKIWVTAKRNFKADPKRPIELSISDTGRGLNVVARSRLFQPRSTERPGESTGLGLYLTKALLTEIDATIECQIRPLWSGANFIIRLPERVA